MNKAALELHTVQSNVTSRIRHLEDSLGVVLFHRGSQGVTMTEAGRRLLPFAVKERQLLHDARKAVSDDGVPRGALTIGALETTAAYRLTDMILQFTALYPQVDLYIKTGTTDTLTAAVINGDFEGAFVSGPVCGSLLDKTHAFTEELVFITALGQGDFDEFIKSKEPKLLVKGPGCCYRHTFERMMESRGCSHARIMEFGTVDAILACASAGLGATLLPRNVVEQSKHGATLRAVRLPEHEAFVDTTFVTRAGAHLSSAVIAFRQMLGEGAATLQAAE